MWRHPLIIFAALLLALAGILWGLVWDLHQLGALRP